MKSKTSKSKEKKDDRKKKGVDAKRLIGPDLPFDYDEVVSATSPEYASYMNRNGMSFRPYEEVKRSAPGFYLLEDRCIWMKAGVINYRPCDYDNDCNSCPFDQAMRSAMGEKVSPKGKERRADWVIRLQERYHVAAKPCIHFKSGFIESPEECTGNYECYHCRVHQMLYTKKQVETIETPKYTSISGYKVADNYYYHLGHSWIRIEHDGWVRVGIDDFISKVFGPADAINLPPVGAFLKQGEVGWVLARNGHKAPMQSPVSGTVFAVNNKVRDQPEIAQDDPYKKGWLFLLDPVNLKLNLKGLYFGKECFEWIEKENQNLLEFLGPEYARLAATGGEPLADIYGHFPEMAWDILVRTFLHTIEK